MRGGVRNEGREVRKESYIVAGQSACRHLAGRLLSIRFIRVDGQGMDKGRPRSTRAMDSGPGAMPAYEEGSFHFCLLASDSGHGLLATCGGHRARSPGARAGRAGRDDRGAEPAHARRTRRGEPGPGVTGAAPVGRARSRRAKRGAASLAVPARPRTRRLPSAACGSPAPPTWCSTRSAAWPPRSPTHRRA